MFIPKNHGFKRQYVYGGSGIFSSIGSFLTRLFTSTAAKQMASSALNVGKNAALDAGKKLIEKSVTKVLTPKSQSVLQKHVGAPSPSPNEVSKKAQNILNKYVNSGNTLKNINSLIDGSGCGNKKCNAIELPDLIKKLNGSGLKVV